MSDGSDTSVFSIRTLSGSVAAHGQGWGPPVRNLNELEFVEGEVYANIWTTDRIVRISPGRAASSAGLIWRAPAFGLQARAEAVLNGIAYDAAGNRLFVTGKLWPKLFEIRIERRAQR